MLVFLLILIAFAYFVVFREKQQPPAPTPTPTTIQPNPQILNRITIQGVSVNNFISKSKNIEKTGEVFAEENADFSIIYHKNDESFLLYISSSPFETVRSAAENVFLQKLGIDKESACRLAVIEQTPFFANPNEAGKVYKLSFCQ